MTEERLQKILAEAGVASRRAAERLILEGRVRVNGRIVSELGSRADAALDRISLDGQPLEPRETLLYLALNKPRGYVTTASDEFGRPTVLDLAFKARERVYPVGRLDLDSEGLVLLTNDGELAQRLTHPRYEVEKEYLALVRGAPESEALRRLRHGVEIEGRITAQATIESVHAPEGLVTPSRHTWLRFVLHEGRKRQVRLMCDAVGHAAVRVIRVRIGPLRLRGLVPGRVRDLSPGEVARLREAAGLPAGDGAAKPPSLPTTRRVSPAGRRDKPADESRPRRPLASGGRAAPHPPR